MAEEDDLEGLEALHRDLQALSAARLPVVERLRHELAAKLEDFRKLLDKEKKKDSSRQALNSGKIQFDDVEYSFNDDFKQTTLQIADALDLDEIEAAKLFLAAQSDSHELDRSAAASAIIRFHRRREFLLDSLRLTIRQCIDPDDGVDLNFQDFVREVIGVRDGRTQNGSQFWQKCLSSMGEIEKWLHQLSDRLQGAYVVGQSPHSELLEVIELQRASLTRQHEVLASISTYLVKLGYATEHNFLALLSALKFIDKHDVILIHYMPILGSLINHLGSSEGNCTLTKARVLHKNIVGGKDGDGWALRNLHATVLAWWLAEYSGRYVEQVAGSPLQGVDLEAEAEERSKLFMSTLRDGAFHFMLSVCQDIKPSPWSDPARASLVSFLLQDTAGLSGDAPQLSEFFQHLIMDQFQTFTESFISNMPDTIRRLRTEEDEQRKQLSSRFQRGPIEYELHLERFLLIICFAFDGYPDAGHAFWSEPDGNLQGFLQWAARRQATPRVAAFCEMLRSISLGEECAEAAHRFLEESSSTGKLRRTSMLSYSLIFAELKYYADHLQDRGSNSQSSPYGSMQNPTDQIAEPESAMMLESYLRLLAHLCSQSTAAREYVKNYPGVNVLSMLFSLSSFSVESRLRASIFGALASLLTDKSKEFNDIVWNALENWVNTVLNTSKSGAVTAALPQEEEYIWTAISSGFEESNSFVELLRSLVTPSAEHLLLNDALPFPESLGSSNRSMGIDKYVDFVLGRVFASEGSTLRPLQLQVMRWNCLNFVETCLSTFNEDLVYFANKTTIAVDSVMETSDLAAYVRLHPFARVMEWFFNQKVLTSLFSTAHQDVHQVNDAAPDSPLVASLLLSIEVMNRIMDHQAMYLDIVRSVIKKTSPSRAPVAHSAIASFEDAVLNNIQIIIDLGLYCGTGHQDLTLASLRLLEKLCTSQKLIAPLPQLSQRSDRNRIITAVEKDNEAERISRALAAAMRPDVRELEAGDSSPGHQVKTTILRFLASCLRASRNRPNLAHLLLGFSCQSAGLEIEEEGLFAEGDSLFHAIVQLAIFYPDSDGESYQSWLGDLKRGCFDVLKQLWTAPISSALSMAELRSSNFAFEVILKQFLISPDALWDGKPCFAPDFFEDAAAIGFQNALRVRGDFYDYIARELRLMAQASMTTSLSQLQSSLLGNTTMPNGDQLPNPSIFDFFDFMSVDIHDDEPVPEAPLLGNLSFKVCRKDEVGPYELSSASQLMILNRNQLKISGQLNTPADEEAYKQQSEALLGYFYRWNMRRSTSFLKAEVLRGWVQAVMVMLETCSFDAASNTLFVLQTVQLILPQIENAYINDSITAAELLRLSKAALQHVDFASSSFDDNKTGDFANDKLLQLFKVSYAGIFSPVTSPDIREICYQVTYRYLCGISSKRAQLGKHVLRAVKAAGDQSLDVLCDDAYAGHGICRVSALMLLDALILLSTKEDSGYILTKLVKYNFISVLIEVLKTMPTELRAASSSDVPFLLSYFETSLSLLLRIAQTRLGAGHILSAGLFQAITESGIFAADPDIGLEFENPNALKKYFELLNAILRIVNGVILSRGQENDQTVLQARDFLTQNKQTMVAVFKRHAKVGGIKLENNLDLSDLVDNFTLLVTVTGYIEYEEETTKPKHPRMMYS